MHNLTAQNQSLVTNASTINVIGTLQETEEKIHK